MSTGTLLVIFLLKLTNLLQVDTNPVDGCRNYTLLDEYDRAQGNVARPYDHCDKGLATGWYRFQGAAGDQIAEKCVLRWRCGTKHPGWLNGTHPTVVNDVGTGEVCFSGRKNCCVWSDIIQVKKCNGYYVYNLTKTPGKCSRYCGSAGAEVDGCANYTILSEANRAQGYVLRGHWKCDWELLTGWYRFQGAAGDRMPDRCVLTERCSTRYPGWLSGAHPTIAEGVVTRNVCYSGRGNCCQMSSIIKVKNCSGYYVYELQRTPSCNLRYCGNAGALDGCNNYTVLSEADRASRNNGTFSRKDLVTGWYRFQGTAGDSIQGKCFPRDCRTGYSGWLRGRHPTVSEGAVTSEVCFRGKKFCCLMSHVIKLKNCSFYYVYELPGIVVTKLLRYCGNESDVTTAITAIVATPATRETATALAIKFKSELDKLDVEENSSLEEAIGLFQNTTGFWKNIDFEDVQEQKESIFRMAACFEKFVLDYSHHHASESTTQIDIVPNSLTLAIRRGSPQNGSDFHLEEPGRKASIRVSSSNFNKNGTVVVGIAYKDLHKLLVTNSSNSYGHGNSRRLSTIIVAVTMDPQPEKLKENVALNFRHLKVGEGKRQCVFWSGLGDKNPGGWSGEGCYAVASTSNAEETECSCNHLTHFAVLFDYSDANSRLTKTDEKILRILTYVGLALSVTGATLTIISYALLTDVHQPISQIRMSLAGSIAAGQILFLAGIGAKENTGVCVTVATLMQYFLVAAFCWMFVEGIYFYLLVVRVYNIANKMHIYHVMSWGFPAVMVAVCLSIAAGKDGLHSFVDDEYCWMSSNSNLIWTFVAIVVVIEILNLLILVRVIKEINTMQPTAGEKHNHHIRLGIRACLVMSPLLGITWLFGLLTPLHKVFIYIFTILNSTQGFLIFVLHCARNNQFRERFKRKLNGIFPAVSDANPARKTSKVNPSDVRIAGIIEVRPCGDVFELKEL